MILGSSPADGGDPAPPVDVSFQPALLGHVRTGALAEVGVRLVSRRDGTVRIDGAGTGGRSSTSVTLRAGEARSVWLPYRVDLTERLVFRVWFENAVVQEHELRSVHPAKSGAPLIVAASARATDLTPTSRFGGIQAARIGTESLPRTLQGYDPVSQLILDVSVFTRLDGPQLSSLEAFIANCGRLSIADLPKRAKPKIRKIAGCGGAFVTFISRQEAADETMAAVSFPENPPLPSAGDLLALVPRDANDRSLLQVTLFLGAYVLLLLIAALAGRPIPAMLLPVGAAAVAIAVWTGRAPGVTGVLWLESQPGQLQARFAAVAAVDGQGPDKAVISLPADARLDPTIDDAWNERFVDGMDNVSASLTIPTRLLSRTTVRLTGTVSMIPPVSVSATDDGLSIRASGPTVTPPGYVVWKGQTFGLPGLEPDATWVPEDGGVSRMPPELRRLDTSKNLPFVAGF